MFDSTEWSAADPAARMQADLAELAADELTEWTAGSLSERLTGLVELRDRLDAELARTSAVWQSQRAWEADGALSPVAWLTHRTPIAKRDAAALVKTGKVLNASPPLADALHCAETTAAHVGALARVMSPRRLAFLGDHEELLAKEAQRLSITDFTVLSRRWASLVDDQLAPDSHDAYRPHNEMYAAVTMNGWLDVKARLDPITGAQFLDAVDHLAPPDPADRPEGVRTLAERRGDALADLCAWYHRGATPGGNPPNLNAIVDIATLSGRPPDLVQGRCELEGIGPITKATLEQLGCGATLTRVVMAGKSEVLDMGRKVRFATPAQQGAIRIRDRHCVFAGCDRSADWCEIHHIDEWHLGGGTDVPRMCCLCRRHHTMIHSTKWRIVANPDGTFTTAHPARGP